MFETVRIQMEAREKVKLLTVHRLLLVGALAVAALMRYWSIDFGLPGKFRPDEGYLVYKGYRTLSGIFDPDFFIYPSFYMYILGLVMLMVQTAGGLLGAFGGLSFAEFVEAAEMATLYYLARLTTATLGVAGVFLTYLLGREAFGRDIGLLGAFLLALNFSHGRESHFATTDIVVTTLITLTLWRLVLLWRRDGLVDYLLVGAFTGLACSSKYTAVVLAVPCLTAHILRIRDRCESMRSAFFWGRPFVALAAGATVFSLTSPYVYLNSDKFWTDINYIRSYSGEGQIGISAQHMLSGWEWILAFGLRYAAGPLLGVLAVAGLFWVVHCAWQRREQRRLLIIPAYVAAVVSLYLWGEVLIFRYMAILMPVLCVTAAAITASTARRLLSHRGALAAASIVLALSALDPVQRLISFNILAAEPDTRQQARQWIEENVRSRHPLVVRGRLKYTRPQVSRRWTFVSFEQFMRGRGQQAAFDDVFIIVDSHEIAAYSPPPPAVIGALIEEEGELVASFSPFVDCDDAGAAVFDQSDAFYYPVAGFDAVSQPGPRIAIYRVRR